MSTAIKPCPKCELPFDESVGQNNLEQHLRVCIGVSPFVLHNRRAGMVVYLSAEEWDALQTANQRMVAGEKDDQFPVSMAVNITARSVWGLSDYGTDDEDDET